MDTIINYLDNLFAPLPKSQQLEQLKEELLTNMEDKYHELKQAGKSENEAIGVVISEFGNIDEIIQEFDIDIEVKKEAIPLLTEKDVDMYIQTKQKTSKMIGIGVFLCILGSALLVLVLQLIEDGFLAGIAENTGELFGLIPLLVLVAIAVGIFIYSSMKIEKYRFIDQEGNFELSAQVRNALERKKDAYQPTFLTSMIIGVALCILSPIVLMVTQTLNENASSYGVVALLFFVAIAVYIFIYFGSTNDSYKKLLKVNEYSVQEKKENRIIGAVAVIVWPLAVCIFLISGFVFNQWHINWIVFLITGILFAMFCAAYSILSEKK